MGKKLLLLPALALLSWANAQNNNGQIDALEELAQKQTVAIPMGDGTQILADVFLPITSDSLLVSFSLLGQNVRLELIPKNTQLVVYPYQKDVFGNDIPNANPYQLPLVLTRTPYDRRGIGGAGGLLTLLGYAYVSQDTRGRFESQGVDFPMYSDGWQKTAYSNLYPALDISNPNDPHNSRRHQDGWDSYQFLLKDLRKDFDLDGDGIAETNSTICNGSIGLAGASAFAISHFQLAAAHKIHPDSAGIKGILAAIATSEHYKHTSFHNGVFRQGLVSEWLRGQLFDMNEDSVGVDVSVFNSLHTPNDYNLSTNEEVWNLALDHLTSLRYGANASLAYPYSEMRHQFDVSAAPVDANGEGQLNGQFSRYGNMDAPTYHLSGWYDIFASGQIESYFKLKNSLSGKNHRRQKLIIGPWAHQTLSARKSGDAFYPENVADVLGFSADGFDLNNPVGLDLGGILQTEMLSFLRYSLNTNGFVPLGEPVVRIPESQRWQQANANLRVRIPSENYDIQLTDLLNFLTGQSGLPNIPVELDFGLGATPFSVPIPSVPAQLPLPISGSFQPPAVVDFEQVPDIRFYVIGPTDTAGNSLGAGNYWAETDRFPIDAAATTWTNLYLHQNGSADFNRPTSDEGFRAYVHQPDSPVTTCGGGNMFEETPDGSRISQGQMDYANPDVINLTMNHSGVISFQTDPLTDTMSIIGYPKVSLFAKSNPQGASNGETDTDFFVRILDVYPDGRELYVVEGAVNARAREFAKSIYDQSENPNASFSNINIGQLYELNFEMMPIAYTFGQGHRLKILISSSNYPRYQSNPNLPIEDGEFFRRQPNDGKSYSYQGQSLQPRAATNSIGFSNLSPSRVELPVYNGNPMQAEILTQPANPSFSLSPNPAQQTVSVQTSVVADYEIRVYNQLGQLVGRQFYPASSAMRVEIGHLAAGAYHVELRDSQTQRSSSQKLLKH